MPSERPARSGSALRRAEPAAPAAECPFRVTAEPILRYDLALDRAGNPVIQRRRDFFAHAGIGGEADDEHELDHGEIGSLTCARRRAASPPPTLPRRSPPRSR